MLVEALGITATLFILLAFSMNKTKAIRFFDSIGALLFVIYGILIHAFSVCLLNFILILINSYKLYKGK